MVELFLGTKQSIVHRAAAGGKNLASGTIYLMHLKAVLSYNKVIFVWITY